MEVLITWLNDAIKDTEQFVYPIIAFAANFKVLKKWN